MFRFSTTNLSGKFGFFRSPATLQHLIESNLKKQQQDFKYFSKLKTLKENLQNKGKICLIFLENSFLILKTKFLMVTSVIINVSISKYLSFKIYYLKKNLN